MGVTTEAAKDVKLFMGVLDNKRNMVKNGNREEEAAVTRRARAERVKFCGESQMPGCEFRAIRPGGGNSSAGFPVPLGSICMVSGV